MEAGAARAVAVAERRLDREPQRGARDRRAGEGGERRRPGDAVGGQSGERLRAADGGLGAGAEAAVEVPAREAAGLERELQRGDVPAAVALARSGRLPTGWRPWRPSARRVRGPTIPSTASPARAWIRRTPAVVAGPGDPSTAPP